MSRLGDGSSPVLCQGLAAQKCRVISLVYGADGAANALDAIVAGGCPLADADARHLADGAGDGTLADHNALQRAIVAVVLGRGLLGNFVFPAAPAQFSLLRVPPALVARVASHNALA